MSIHIWERIGPDERDWRCSLCGKNWWTDEEPPEHTTDTDYCWCQPRVEDVLPDGRVIIHRRTADGRE